MPRRVILATVVAALVCAWAAPAAAHVTVDPPSVPKGGTATISFVVPNESAAARTSRVQVFFPPPPDTIASVAVEAMPGWHHTIKTEKLSSPIETDDGSIDEVVSSITWTSNSIVTAIGNDEFAAFTINADGIPDGADQLAFRVVQSYSDGSSVRWIDPVTEGGPEAEHPTPILVLTDGSDAAGPTTTQVEADGTTTVAATEDNSARALGVIAIVLGGVALVAATGALMRRRRVSDSSG